VCDEAIVTEARSLVSVVDDDESVRESLPDLLSVLGFDVQAFSSAEEFLASEFVDQTDCLIVDVAMPGMTGPELQQELTRQGRAIPLVFITARIDEEVRRNVVKRGAAACLFKPFTEEALVEALQLALRPKAAP
jgi:FixJ family two-component response regulator